MAEAQPKKQRGGHAYGRRVQQMSNTAEEGELCIYHGHSLGRFLRTQCDLIVTKLVFVALQGLEKVVSPLTLTVCSRSTGRKL